MKIKMSGNRIGLWNLKGNFKKYIDISMEKFQVTSKNKVTRLPTRGHYDKKTVYEILDAGFVCHTGFVVDNQPYVIPMGYGRKGDKIYLHGATTSRLMKNLSQGIAVCITVTHLDGIVLARSAFHSSMNYRSAVVFGTAKLVEDQNKEDALFYITEQILKGRWNECRATKEIELKATSVLEVKIDTASCKIRTGPPVDDDEDYDLPIWAGVLPLKLICETPIADPKLSSGIQVMKSVLNAT